MPGLTDKAVPDKKYDLLWMGIDVGSTTVKVIVVDDATDQILWQDYQRHDTKQPEKALEMLKRIEADLPPMELWRMTLDPGYRSVVMTIHHGTPIEATGRGPDPVLATWDAVCRVEQALRERCGTTRPRVRARA